MFSYVPQGNMIISGTLRENISLCDSTVSDEDIEKAARAAVIYDFINSLPDKFDTVISERGAGLSEGQIQRIVLRVRYFSMHRLYCLTKQPLL